MSSSHLLGVGSTGPRRRWTLARVLKGSPRSLRVMAPPPYFMLYFILSTPPLCGIPVSLDVKIKTLFLFQNISILECMRFWQKAFDVKDPRNRALCKGRPKLRPPLRNPKFEKRSGQLQNMSMLVIICRSGAFLRCLLRS